MMLNLFSVFDPYIGLYCFNWMSSMIILLMIPTNYWLYKSRWYEVINLVMNGLWSEFKLILVTNFNVNNLLIFITLLFYILINNFMGLYPYIFTSSSHLSFALTFSMSLWMGLMMFGWIMNMNFMFSHLVPLGTPFMLMFFMVLIETLSNLIRPMTLAIRLVANMIAGHLLLTLLSSMPTTFILMNLTIIIAQLLLFTLELAVSLIQSYVFVILMTLYLKETN